MMILSIKSTMPSLSSIIVNSSNPIFSSHTRRGLAHNLYFIIIRNTRFFFQKSDQFISPLRRFDFVKQKFWGQFGIDISQSDWKKENRRENDQRPIQIQAMLFRIIGRIDQSIDFFIRIGFVFNHDLNSFKQLTLVYLKNLSKSLKTQHLV